MNPLPGRTRALLLALFLLAWAWRLHGLDVQSLWRDEMDSLLFATRPLAQVLGNFTRPGENGPLFFLGLRGWLAAAGRSEFALRFPSAVAGVLALPLIFVWGKRLGDARLGLLAALLLAVNPYHLWYSQEGKMYALVVTLVLLGMWAFVRAAEKGGLGRWLLWLIVTTVSIYTHVLTVWIVPMQLLWLLLHPRWRRRWRDFALALLALILPYLPLIWWQWALLRDADFRTGYAFIPLSRMLLTLFSGQLWGVLPLPARWFFAPAIFLLLAALLLPRGGVRPRRLLLIWWFLPALGLFALSLRTPFFTDRYLIWTLPALLLLIAGGLIEVAGSSRALAALLLLILLGWQTVAGWQQTAQPFKSDFRAAAVYVAPRRQAQDLTLFLIPYIRHTYRYYDPGPYPWAEAPYANREPDAAHLPAALQAIAAGYEGLWLIESEADFYDRQGLIRGWLATAGQLQDQAHFTRVSVYYYRLGND